MSDTRQIDRERLEYVGAMLAELHRLSDENQHPMLSYLIEMAYLEARELVEGEGASGRGDKRDAVA